MYSRNICCTLCMGPCLGHCRAGTRFGTPCSPRDDPRSSIPQSWQTRQTWRWRFSICYRTCPNPCTWHGSLPYATVNTTLLIEQTIPQICYWKLTVERCEHGNTKRWMNKFLTRNQWPSKMQQRHWQRQKEENSHNIFTMHTIIAYLGCLCQCLISVKVVSTAHYAYLLEWVETELALLSLRHTQSGQRCLLQPICLHLFKCRTHRFIRSQ